VSVFELVRIEEPMRQHRDARGQQGHGGERHEAEARGAFDDGSLS
jgi:hypothetical protein